MGLEMFGTVFAEFAIASLFSCLVTLIDGIEY